MGNIKIKKFIKASRCFNYEIAEKIGISEVTFSQWFRKELTEEQNNKILTAIEKLKKEVK